MSNNLSDKDFHHWNKWNNTRKSDDLGNLLKQTEKIRYREVQRWSGTLSPVSLNSEAIKLSVKAFSTFNPNAGVKLSTHLTNNLKKLSRINYSEQNIVRMPENRQMKFHSYNQASKELEDKLGRDPNTDELADHLSWNPNEVKRFQRELRSEFITSEPPPAIFELPKEQDDRRIHFAYQDMDDIDKVIFEHTTGFGGNKILNNAALMKKTGLNQGQVSYRKRLVVQKIKKIQAREK